MSQLFYEILANNQIRSKDNSAECWSIATEHYLPEASERLLWIFL